MQTQFRAVPLGPPSPSHIWQLYQSISTDETLSNTFFGRLIKFLTAECLCQTLLGSAYWNLIRCISVFSHPKDKGIRASFIHNLGMTRSQMPSPLGIPLTPTYGEGGGEKQRRGASRKLRRQRHFDWVAINFSFAIQTCRPINSQIHPNRPRRYTHTHAHRLYNEATALAFHSCELSCIATGAANRAFCDGGGEKLGQKPRVGLKSEWVAKSRGPEWRNVCLRLSRPVNNVCA